MAFNAKYNSAVEASLTVTETKTLQANPPAPSSITPDVTIGVNIPTSFLNSAFTLTADGNNAITNIVFNPQTLANTTNATHLSTIQNNFIANPSLSGSLAGAGKQIGIPATFQDDLSNDISPISIYLTDDANFKYGEIYNDWLVSASSEPATVTADEITPFTGSNDITSLFSAVNLIGAITDTTDPLVNLLDQLKAGSKITGATTTFATGDSISLYVRYAIRKTVKFVTYNANPFTITLNSNTYIIDDGTTSSETGVFVVPDTSTLPLNATNAGNAFVTVEWQFIGT
jgi:hypothetical protein